MEVLGPCPQQLRREQFGDIVLNNRCQLLQVASQQLKMEETGKNYDRWNMTSFLAATDSEPLTRTRT